MEKISFTRKLRHLYAPSSKSFSQVAVPTMRFVKIDGVGNPNTAQAYRDALAWVYSVSYSLKFASKLTLGRDYAVPPLEGLWWADDIGSFARGDKENWSWTVMIMVPDWINRQMFDQAVDKSTRKLGSPPPSLRLESYEEGLCVQILHIGPYAAEAPTIAALHDKYLPDHGLTERGVHHEIYLSDPRRTAPEKLKTIIRQPVSSGIVKDASVSTVSP